MTNSHDDHTLRDDITATLALADPVDSERLVEAWNDSDASTALLVSITEDTGRDARDERLTPTRWQSSPRSRRARLAMLGAAAAVVTAIVAGIAPWSDDPAYAIRELPGGVIEVNWQSDLRSGREIAEELRSWGVDAQVIAVPASPSAVGTVVATALPDADVGPVPGITWGEDGTEEVFTWRIDPAVFKGPVRIELGVEPEAGTPYQVAEEVFEPGEVLGGLHCVLGQPLHATDLVPHLQRLGLTARWEVAEPVPGDPLAMHEHAVDDVPDGDVLWGYAVDSTTIRFSVRRDGTDLGQIEARLSDVPCTAKQAARW